MVEPLRLFHPTTLVIAHPALRQDCMAKTLSTAAQIDILAQNTMEGRKKGCFYLITDEKERKNKNK